MTAIAALIHSIARQKRLANTGIEMPQHALVIGHRRCAYYIFRRWVFLVFFLSVAFPARPYIRLPQPVPISKGRQGGCYLKYDPFENSSHVGR